MEAIEYTCIAFIYAVLKTGDQHDLRVVYDCIGKVWPSYEGIPEELQRVIRQAVADMFNRASANTLVPPEFWIELPFEDVRRLMACADNRDLYDTAEPMIIQKRNELLMEGIRSIQSQTGDTVDNRFLKIRKKLSEFKGQPCQVEGLVELLEEIARTLIGLQCPLLNAYTDTFEFNAFSFFEEPTLHNAMLHQIEQKTPMSTEQCLLRIQALKGHSDISSIGRPSTVQVLLMQTPPGDTRVFVALTELQAAEKRKAKHLESPNKRIR